MDIMYTGYSILH